MPDPCGPDSSNVKAFLKLVRYAEHYPDERDDGYATLYGGGSFSDFSTHPNRRVTKWGHTSTAAGAYQILYPTWAEAKRKGIVADFTPASQDRLAYEKLKTRGALPFVCAGQVAHACARLRNEWTSLPGAKQSRMSMTIAEAAFTRYGGTAGR